MTIAFLVRHGQASYQTEPRGLLTDVGRRQADAVGEFFARTGKRFDACCVGTLPRQVATMEAIRRHLNGAAPTLTAPELDEHDTPAILEAQWPELAPREPSLAALVNAPDIDREAFGRLLETGLMRWAKGEFRSAQVETWADFTTRVRSGLQRVAGVFEDKEKVLVVTSAGPIAVAAQWALGLDDETTIRLAWRVRNASVSLLKIDGARAELMSFNSVAHLEMAPDPALRTFL